MLKTESASALVLAIDVRPPESVMPWMRTTGAVALPCVVRLAGSFVWVGSSSSFCEDDLRPDVREVAALGDETLEVARAAGGQDAVDPLVDAAARGRLARVERLDLHVERVARRDGRARAPHAEHEAQVREALRGHAVGVGAAELEEIGRTGRGQGLGAASAFTGGANVWMSWFIVRIGA